MEVDWEESEDASTELNPDVSGSSSPEGEDTEAVASQEAHRESSVENENEETQTQDTQASLQESGLNPDAEDLSGEDTRLRQLYCCVVNGEFFKFKETLTEIADMDNINLSEYMYEEVEYISELDRHATVLQVVCGEGQKSMLEELCKLGVDLNFRGKYGKTPLNIACLHGHLDLVRALISQGADVNCCNLDGECDTPLITSVACYQPESNSGERYLDICRLLLASGADCNTLDTNGSSALFVAVTKSDARLTALLLQYNADVNLASPRLGNALCCAIGAQSRVNAQLLLRSGCSVNVLAETSNGYSGSTPLHYALINNDLGLMLELLEAGADPLEAYVPGEAAAPSSLLHNAAAEQRLIALWLLIALGGDVNSQQHLRHDTPMLVCARIGCSVGVRLLLRFGADPELESRVGTTAVWAAVRENHVDVLGVLLETCCSLETPSMEYHMYMPLSPLEIALRLQSWKMALTLLKSGASHRTSTLTNALPAESVSPGGGQGMQRARAAYRLAPRDHLALRELRAWRTQPQGLRHACRVVLRTHFRRRLPALLEVLHYPVSLQNYLFMKDLT